MRLFREIDDDEVISFLFFIRMYRLRLMQIKEIGNSTDRVPISDFFIFPEYVVLNKWLL